MNSQISFLEKIFSKKQKVIDNFITLKDLTIQKKEKAPLLSGEMKHSLRREILPFPRCLRPVFFGDRLVYRGQPLVTVPMNASHELGDSCHMVSIPFVSRFSVKLVPLLKRSGLLTALDRLLKLPGQPGRQFRHKN